MTNASKRGRKPKYLHTIVLDSVNAREVYKKYKQSRKDDTVQQPYYTPIGEYPAKNGETPNNSQVTELSNRKKQANPFLDGAKAGKSITMIDYVNYGCLPERTDLWCAHDHHQFSTSPIGIPIRYVAKRVDKLQTIDNKISGTNDYFLTFGIFCSFPCCLAFLEERRGDFFFRNSKSLLYSLYYKLYKTELDVKAAPSWQCLKVHGGSLSIEEFRKSFCSCNYVITENIKRPFMVSVGKYIEEKRCGFL